MKQNKILFAFAFVCLCVPFSAAQVKFIRKGPKPERIGIVLTGGDAIVSPSSTTMLTGHIADAQGQGLTGKVEWTLDPASIPYAEIEPGNEAGTLILRGRSNPPERAEIKQVQVLARSGNLASNLVIPYRLKRIPATVKFDQESPRVELGKTTLLTATVSDENGAALSARGISLKVDDPDSAKWVKIGSPTYEDEGRVTFAVEGLFAESSAFPETVIVSVRDDKRSVSQLPIRLAVPKMSISIVGPDDKPLPSDKTLYGTGNPLTLKASASGAPAEALKLFKWDIPLDAKEKEYVIYRADGDKLIISGLANDGNGPKNIPVRVGIANVFSPLLMLSWNQAPLRADYSVLPDNVARDVFGKTVADDYYCLGVTVANTSNRDYQITSIVFVNNGIRTIAAPYGIVNASQAKRKAWNPRTLAITAATAMGTVLTGFTPFFFNLAHQNQFSKFINLFAIPGKDAVSSVFPDSSKLESASLDAFGYRGDRFITNTPTPVSIMFVPKKFADLGAEKDNPARVKAHLGVIEVQGFPMERSSTGPVILSTP